MKLHPSEPIGSIEEFLCQLKISRYKVTMMTCNNIGQIVVSLMDSETMNSAESGAYKSFGSIFFIDDSFAKIESFEELILHCQNSYSNIIGEKRYSFDNGNWSQYSTTDETRLSELRDTEVSAMYERRNRDDEPWLDKIIEEYQYKEVLNVLPMWHVNKEDIIFEEQPEILDALLLCNGFEIIHNVNFDRLLDNMIKVRAEVYRERKLFHEEFDDRKIARVIHHWLNGDKLIPPTITIESGIDGALFPTDGKHRLNVALFLGSTEIPILVLSSQHAEILNILQHA